MLILGIDPGTATTGFGLLEVKNNCVEAVDFGLIETDKDGDFGKRLISINKQLSSVIKRRRPDIVVMEKLFFATNVKTATRVGRAMGVIVYTVARAGIEMCEYAPGTIKKQITGNGRADKKMVQRSLRKILGAKVRSKVHKKTHFDNAADGLAVALCHAYNIFSDIKRG